MKIANDGLFFSFGTSTPEACSFHAVCEGKKKKAAHYAAFQLGMISPVGELHSGLLIDYSFFTKALFWKNAMP